MAAKAVLVVRWLCSETMDPLLQRVLSSGVLLNCVNLKQSAWSLIQSHRSFRVLYTIGHLICCDVAHTLSAVAYQLHRCTPYCDNHFSSTSLSLLSLSRSLALSSP